MGRAENVGQKIYQMRVVLKDIEPPIWRRFLIEDNATLGKLHRTLQVLMGWTDTHLHQFLIKGKYYGVPDPEETMKTTSEKHVRLAGLILHEDMKFTYEYDFGDGWEHELVVEKILPPIPGAKYPVCLAGERGGPPEDCGGAYGYVELLEILKSARHPEYQERLEWVGDYFAPETFDVGETNTILRRVK